MAILHALQIGEGDEILIQAFTCNAVPNPIIWMGAKPVYADITDDLNIDPADIERKITPKTKAIIVQHTFGMPADMDRILEIAARRNLYVIEDCAHALGARYKGRLVGTLGDASFFSFGRDKVISSVYGGMAASNNPEIAKKIEEFWNQCEYPSRFWIFQQLVHPIIFAVALPLYNVLNIGKIVIRVAQKIKLLSLAVTGAEKHGAKPPYFPRRMPEALAALPLHQFKKLEYFNEHRRQLAKFYLEKCIPLQFRSIYGSPTTIDREPVFLRWSLFSDIRDEILLKGRKRGVYLGDWYTSVIAPHDTDLTKMQYAMGSCPKAEAAAQQIFNLPTHINISSKDAQKIVEFLNSIQ
jgi:dTDP-4-amino-4,6-dideoxygalactose transaminase